VNSSGIANVSSALGVDDNAERELANINQIPGCHRRGSTNQQDAASDSHSYARGEPHAPTPKPCKKKPSKSILPSIYPRRRKIALSVGPFGSCGISSDLFHPHDGNALGDDERAP
jgi:hypothetical protein